jgi:hypothetical protein
MTFKKGDTVMYHGTVYSDYVIVDEVLETGDEGTEYSVRFLGDDFTFIAHESELSDDPPF